MGTATSIGDSFTHGGQHRTLSPKANLVPYAKGMRGQAAPNSGAALAAFKRWIKRGPRLGRKKLAEFVLREARKRGFLGELKSAREGKTEREIAGGQI